jgi:hypothetical protein
VNNLVKEHCILWDTVEGCNTFEGFYAKMVPNFEINHSVPDEIKNRLAVIQKLIEYSYYEYEFIDVAFLMMFQTLEFSLHLKFISLNPNKKGKKNLKPYLDWAVSSKVISLSKDEMELLFMLRNHVMHLKQESVLGITILRRIKLIGQLIFKLFHQSSN